MSNWVLFTIGTVLVLAGVAFACGRYPDQMKRLRDKLLRRKD
jgi:hypothetical protein